VPNPGQLIATTRNVDAKRSTSGRISRPIELFAEIGALGPSTLIYHVTLPTEIEIEHLRSSRTAVSYSRQPACCHYRTA
jgi:hypothetical protein